jgi:hypothetical protein
MCYIIQVIQIKSDFFPTKDCIIYVMEFCFDTTLLLYLDIGLIIVTLTCYVIYSMLAMSTVLYKIRITKVCVMIIDNYYNAIYILSTT